MKTMNIDKIRKRTKQFLKRRPLQDKQARKVLAKFPRWNDDTAQFMAVETLIILYETYKGEQYKLGVLESYLESIRIYSQRWVDWQIATEKGEDEC